MGSGELAGLPGQQRSMRSRNVGGYIQDLGARPATAKHVTAWRQDESPARPGWYGNGQLIPSQPGPRRQTGGRRGQEPWGNPASVPADPAKLRKLLLTGVAGPNDPTVRIAEQLAADRPFYSGKHRKFDMNLGVISSVPSV